MRLALQHCVWTLIYIATIGIDWYIGSIFIKKETNIVANASTPVDASQVHNRKRVVSVVAPAFNEEECIGKFCSEVLAVANERQDLTWEIIIVDDGSVDSTVQKVHEMRESDSRLHLLSLQRNFGQEAAMLAGLSRACGDVIVLLDADLQDPPRLISDMIDKLDTGLEIVHGRYERKGRGLLRRVFTFAYYRILRTLVGKNHAPSAYVSNFHVMSRRAVDLYLSMPEHDRYTRGMFWWLGLKTGEVSFPRFPRTLGKTKYGVQKLISVGLSGITSLSTAPLRWAVYIGFGACLFAFMCIVYIIVSIITDNSVPGWASLLGAILIFSGVQLIMLGVIGEYIGKILVEVKRRPSYIEREFTGGHQSPTTDTQHPKQ